MVEAITFSELRKVQKQESRQEELTDLDDDFLLSVADYLETKKEASGESREYRNAKRVFEKIIGLREEKIFRNATLAVKSEVDASELSLLPVEQKLFRDLMKRFQEHREDVGERLENGMPDTDANAEMAGTGSKEAEESSEPDDGDDLAQKEDSGLITVEMTSEVPEFMGTDLETYGPFDEGETAEVPEENAEILVNRGSAEEVEG